MLHFGTADYARPSNLRFPVMHRFVVFLLSIIMTRAASLIEEKKSKGGQKNLFDVAIIGAGYAGLSSALLLGRYLVSAVVFDGGRATAS